MAMKQRPILEAILRFLGDKPKKNQWRHLWLIDSGHGRWQPGKRSPVFIHPSTNVRVQVEEWWINMKVTRWMIEYLKDHGISCVEVNRMPEYRDQWLSGPNSRIDRMNELYAQSLLPVRGYSNHFNAVSSDGEFKVTKGIEAYHYPGSAEGYLMCRHWLDTVADEMQLPIRSQRGDNGVIARGDLKILAGTKFPTILAEGPFFTDYETCRNMLSDPAWLESYAIACAKGIMNYEYIKS